MGLPIFGQDVWLTSFWGFDHGTWGCLGFTQESMRKYFLRESPNGAIVAIYVTKGKGPENMRGKVIGLLQIGNRIGHLRDFISGDAWAQKELRQDSRGKWDFAIQATRAWRIVEEDWKPVEELFPRACRENNAQLVGAQGVQLEADEANRLLDLTVYEVPVYGQTGSIASALQPFKNVLKPTKAVNRAGFAGGVFVQIRRPWRPDLERRKIAPLLRLAGYCRSTPAAGGG